MFSNFKNKNRIYLDYAASTPVNTSMQKKIPKIPKGALIANPGALHREALLAKGVIADARKRVADVLNVQSDEIIFTASATESDNMAVQGAILNFLKKGIAPSRILLCVSELEHPAVLETTKQIAKRYGIKTHIIKAVDGVVDIKDIVVSEDIEACLISVMYVHNELGTVQPVRDIAKRVRFLRKQVPDTQILFHIDATQAPLFFSLSIPQIGCDMMTIGSTKLYMRKGIGMLYKSRLVQLAPIMYGGSQEFGLRPGTESVELIHEYSYALQIAQQEREQFSEKIKALQDYFEKEIIKNFSQIHISAKDIKENIQRTPHITHLAIPDFDSELLVIELDARGIAVSSQSACIEEESVDSYVKRLYPQNTGTLRFSFGKDTSKKDLDRAIGALKNVFEKYKK